MNEKSKINYFYFSFLLFILLALHLYHVFLVHSPSLGTSFIFAVHAVGQTLLEVLLLSLIASTLRKYFHKIFYTIFLQFTFILVIAHIIDFYLIRLMDLSIWHGLSFIVEESWENFIEILKSSHVSIKTWLLGAVGAVAVFALGIAIQRITDKYSQKKPLYFSYHFFAKPFCALALFLLLWNAGFNKSPFSEHFARALPFKKTFISPKKEILSIASALKPFKDEQCITKMLANCDFQTKRRPPIFLFVIESLREDFLTPDVAPHIHNFKTVNNCNNLTFSNSNATHLSWFSLFFSKYPFYWGEVQRQKWESGAPSLQLLKKLGYQVHVYSSSRLAFYKMNKLIFGKNLQLIDSLHEYSAEEGRAPWQCDKQNFSKLKEDLLANTENEGKLFIVFLESTHFGYSWPQETMTCFLPIVDKIDYLQPSHDTTYLEEIKNRYRNSIHYVDHLIGDAIQTINQSKCTEKPVIVITGDHGEEFYEEGYLFHASNLNEIQTRVPIYYNLEGLQPRITSHMDIFPTLLHHIDGDGRFFEFFEGNSLFNPQASSFIVSGRYNASRSPFEFFIHDGQNKLHARFTEENSIFECQDLHVLPSSKKTSQKEDFAPAINRIFSR